MVNYAGSKDAAEAVAKEIEGMGVKALAVKVCPSPFLSSCCRNVLLNQFKLSWALGWKILTYVNDCAVRHFQPR